MLDELREGILHDFSDQVSGSIDYLWTDRRLVHYIDEAQRRFARTSLCLRDGTTEEVTQVQLVAGQKEYCLHEKIIALVSAKYKGDAADLARAGHAAFNDYYKPDGYWINPSNLSQLPPGKVLAYDTDEFILPDSKGTMARMNMRVYPEPSTQYANQIHLRVVRLPLIKLTTNGHKWVKDMSPDERETFMCVTPEIPEEHHLDILDWAAHLALRIVDHDQGDPDRSAEFMQSFEDKAKRARDLVMRKMFTPSLWGFGRNGFSWESSKY